MRYDPSLPDETVNVSEGSVLKEAAILVIGVCAIASVAVAILSFAIEYIVVSLPSGAETRLFANFWNDLETIDDHPDAHRLQELTWRLVEHDHLPQEYFRVAVFESEVPNAMAFPGGLIVFTTALLDSVRTENELAFVLGHELGHYKNRDHLRGLGWGVSLALVATALGLGDGAMGGLATVTASLTQRRFGREQELAADLFGLVMLEKQYGHVGGARNVFETLLSRPRDEEATDGADASGRFSRYFDSHPSNPDRIAALEEMARDRGLPLTGDQASWSATVVPDANSDEAEVGTAEVNHL